MGQVHRLLLRDLLKGKASFLVRLKYASEHFILPMEKV